MICDVVFAQSYVGSLCLNQQASVGFWLKAAPQVSSGRKREPRTEPTAQTYLSLAIVFKSYERKGQTVS